MIAWKNIGNEMVVGTYNGRLVFTIMRLTNGVYYAVALFGTFDTYTATNIMRLTNAAQEFFSTWRETNKVLFEGEKK